MKTIEELLYEIKTREKQELVNALHKFGDYSIKDGFYICFEQDNPIIAGYVGEEPCDIVVTKVMVRDNGYVYINGYEKNNPITQYMDIEPEEIFAGHLDYVTQEVIGLHAKE